MNNQRMFLLPSLMIAFCTGILVAGAEETKGTIKETGFGKFKLEEKGGTVRLFHIAKKTTTYEPDTWRPSEKDKVTIAFTQIRKRSATILRVDKITLTKAGPNTITIESPVKVEIIKFGRTGVIVKLTDQAKGKEIRFTKHRKTRYIPAGWAPSPGEKARIEFVIKPSRFTNGLNYQANKIEKID